jgi:hypothetical protein
LLYWYKSTNNDAAAGTEEEASASFSLSLGVDALLADVEVA